MEKYPFVYLNNMENKGDCFIWFDGNLAGKERRFIRECFSSIVSDFFIWGDCFLYFVCETDPADFNRCLEKIHFIVPIIFVIGPYVSYEWNAYSKTKIDDVAEIIVKYVDNNHWIINGDMKKRTKSILSYSEEHIKVFRRNFIKIVIMAAEFGERKLYTFRSVGKISENLRSIIR
jgi:hypothetical protein